MRDAENIELSSDLLLEIDEHGAVCGLEFLNTNEQSLRATIAESARSLFDEAGDELSGGPI